MPVHVSLVPHQPPARQRLPLGFFFFALSLYLSLSLSLSLCLSLSASPGLLGLAVTGLWLLALLRHYEDALRSRPRREQEAAHKKES